MSKALPSNLPLQCFEAIVSWNPVLLLHWIFTKPMFNLESSVVHGQLTGAQHGSMNACLASLGRNLAYCLYAGELSSRARTNTLLGADKQK
jgi:hypothetical protein